MDLGREQKPYVVEPLEDPVPREREETAPDRPAPERTPVRTPEEVPA